IEIETETIFRFELDIIRHENISSDLNRYRKACVYRQHRLNINNSKNSEKIIELLNYIEHAAKPLQTLFNKREKLSVFLDALTASLEKLGCLPALEQDHAGEAIIRLFQKLKESIIVCDIEMDWLSFRHWLGKKLEENTFKPESNHKYYVELLHLTQSTLGHYEALIIGSMTQDSFPGSPKQTPFFNQSVRLELNLPSPQAQIQSKFYHFRRLLESAPNILLTMHAGPQENLPSAWLSLLKNFHQLSYNSSLENDDLHHWIETWKNFSFRSPDLPANKDADKAKISHTQLPETLSASAHQTLINCPYAFFAAQILRLRAPDEIRDTLAKSDYGERVHLCLQAFHAGDIKKLPGPFPEVVTTENRETAVIFLTEISKQVFSQDIEDNFRHRGWFKRWLQQIPKYIDWEINRARHWKFKTGEFAASKTLRNNIKLHGRVDRMDSSSDGLAVIDYKTGSIPKITDVETGEAVQLAHYALSSDDNVTRIEYLQLEDSQKKQVISKCELEKEDLLELKHHTEERLIKLYRTATEGNPLEAWGTEKSCQYCQFTGLCRKQFR
ncbi:MAG: PD-(D/E)XK nuclease family protein, partial [Gammaproteobacteria bacterium]|nr:PD-(D/E)XK nuclease family protein [Gammaproteobacteria bacterium]